MTLKNKNSAYDLAEFSMHFNEESGGMSAALWQFRYNILYISSGWLLAAAVWFSLPVIFIAGMSFVFLSWFFVEGYIKNLHRKHYEQYFSVKSRLRGHINEPEILEITPEYFVIRKEFSTTSTLWSNVELKENEDYWFIFITSLSAIVIKKSDHAFPETYEFINTLREKSLKELS